jgi:predicted secreted protein
LNRCAQLIALNQNSNGQEYTVPVGQTFILFLNSNPSTGYQWNKDSWDEEVVSLTSRNFEAGGNKALVGQEGKEGFVFKALKTGSTEIKLNYARPWESVQPEETYNLKVKVVAPQSESAEVQMSLKPVKSKNDLVDVELNIPQIEGLKNEQVQSAINRHFMEDANALKDDLEAEADEAKRGSEQSGYTFQPYGLWSICEKYCENGDILSLYVDYYTYTGGAHGSTERRAYNYDLQTGERLELKDLFKMGYDYKAALNEQVKARIAARPENYFDGDMGFQGINESNFYLENNILMLYFDEYEIAPYAVGIPQFKLPLNLFGNNLKDEY